MLIYLPHLITNSQDKSKLMQQSQIRRIVSLISIQYPQENTFSLSSGKDNRYKFLEGSLPAFFPNFTSMHLTDNEDDIDLKGIVYKGKKHIDISDITDELGQNIPSYNIKLIKNQIIELSGFMDILGLREFEITLQKYDVMNGNILFTHVGRIISMNESQNSVICCDVESILSKMNMNLSDQYSPICRAQFCDKKCGLKIKNFITYCIVVDMIDCDRIAIDREIKEDYDIILVEGLYQIEVIERQGSTLRILNSNHYKIPKGSNAILAKNCDKRIHTCASKYNNVINFRGEPNINDTISFVL